MIKQIILYYLQVRTVSYMSALSTGNQPELSSTILALLILRVTLGHGIGL